MFHNPKDAHQWSSILTVRLGEGRQIVCSLPLCFPTGCCSMDFTSVVCPYSGAPAFTQEVYYQASKANINKYQEMPARKILLPIDGSEISEKTAKWYLDVISELSDTVILGHVVDKKMPKFAYLGPTYEEFEKVEQEHKDKLKEIHDRFEALLESRGGIVHKFVYETGEHAAGFHLCHMAKEEGVDLIIIGSRGHGTLRRTIMGSVSDYVLHHALVPVTIYHDEQVPHH